jgi:hypothetical protein
MNIKYMFKIFIVPEEKNFCSVSLKFSLQKSFTDLILENKKSFFCVTIIQGFFNEFFFNKF